MIESWIIDIGITLLGNAVKKSLKEEIRRQAKEAAIKKKIGTAAVITAGVAGTAYGGKKLYDHYKKDKT